jgi:flagella basal body P-ring formation protein FlgA
VNSMLLVSIACIAMFCAELSAAACVPVAGSRIQGRDLAAADSRFNALPATLTIGFAPLPGTKKVFTIQELLRIAKTNGIAMDAAQELCFEIPLQTLTAEHAAESMRQALPPGASLKIVELPAVNIPVSGMLEFPIEGLEPALPINKGVQLWRGRVKYAESRQVLVWARVEVTAEQRTVVAVRDLISGASIDRAALRIETKVGPLQRERLASRFEEVEGHVVSRSVNAGAFVPLSIVAEAPSVRRGDPVTVEVQSGFAHLHFEAIAQNSAHTGEMVELKNPLNGKLFRARLDADARASIVVGGRKQ